MKDLNAMFKLCMAEVKSVGIVPGNITSITSNSRAKHRYGLCRHTDRGYEINISSRLLDDRNPDKALKNTIIHEILHSCEGCMNHGDKWQRYANIMNRTYGYNIKRVSNDKELNLCEESKPNFKYLLKCEECGAVWGKDRMCGLVGYPELYRCKCGGHIIRIK